MANKSFTQILLIAGLFVVFAVALSAVYKVTAPIIEANNQGAELEPLYGVMPDASGFEKLEFETVPETVKSVWKEKSGNGYVVRCATNKGYTGEFIELTVAVANDGKISGISLDAYPETKDFGTETYPQTYVGQDSTLAGAEIVGGVTFSSSAFKGAVADAFAVLIDNNLIKAGIKSADQIMAEMLPSAAGFLSNPMGMAQVSDLAVSGTIVQAWKANNGIGAAYWIKDAGDVMVVVNSCLDTKVLDLDGNQITDQAASDQAKAAAGSVIKSKAKTDLKKVTKLMPAGAVITEIAPKGVFSSVSTVFKAETADGVITTFVCRPYGFSNETMVIYVAIDSEGRINTLTADELIIEPEYFQDYTLEPASYKAGFNGLTKDTYTGEVALISGATLSTNAIHQAVVDAFDAFSILKGGNN